jgi:hypothetical protein
VLVLLVGPKGSVSLLNVGLTDAEIVAALERILPTSS